MRTGDLLHLAAESLARARAAVDGERRHRPNEVIAALMDAARRTNEYIQRTQPWKLAKDETQRGGQTIAFALAIGATRQVCHLETCFCTRNQAFAYLQRNRTAFEQMARELECSVDYLINEAMKQYANAGGRLFASHWHRYWFDTSEMDAENPAGPPSPFEAMASMS